MKPEVRWLSALSRTTCYGIIRAESVSHRSQPPNTDMSESYVGQKPQLGGPQPSLLLCFLMCDPVPRAFMVS